MLSNLVSIKQRAQNLSRKLISVKIIIDPSIKWEFLKKVSFQRGNQKSRQLINNGIYAWQAYKFGSKIWLPTFEDTVQHKWWMPLRNFYFLKKSWTLCFNVKFRINNAQKRPKQNEHNKSPKQLKQRQMNTQIMAKKRRHEGHA
jgi:hypothetical protein